MYTQLLKKPQNSLISICTILTLSREPSFCRLCADVGATYICKTFDQRDFHHKPRIVHKSNRGSLTNPWSIRQTKHNLKKSMALILNTNVLKVEAFPRPSALKKMCCIDRNSNIIPRTIILNF